MAAYSLFVCLTPTHALHTPTHALHISTPHMHCTHPHMHCTHTTHALHTHPHMHCTHTHTAQEANREARSTRPQGKPHPHLMSSKPTSGGCAFQHTMDELLKSAGIPETLEDSDLCGPSQVSSLTDHTHLCTALLSQPRCIACWTWFIRSR